MDIMSLELQSKLAKLNTSAHLLIRHCLIGLNGTFTQLVCWSILSKHSHASHDHEWMVVN